MPRAPKRRTTTRTPARAASRPTANARGYTYRWQRYRLTFLAANPLCVHCSTTTTPVPATDVDHIRPVTSATDPAFWVSANHQALCHDCHSTKTATEDRTRGRNH